MKLTPPERLILLTLFEIREKLDGDENDTFWSNAAEIVRRGYEGLYDRLPALDSETPTMPKDRCDFVENVLRMYTVLSDYLRANPDDAHAHGHRWAKFAGFDGNGEGAYLGYARFIVERMGFYPNLLPGDTDGFNSHVPTHERYRQMLGEWKGRGEPTELSADDARAILDPKPPAPPRRGDDEDRPRRGDKFRM